MRRRSTTRAHDRATPSVPRAKPAHEAQALQRPSVTPSPLSTFLLLCSLRLLSAFTTPIADCDETFNYWEPMHYLLYGHGLQTWEYSPAYALRSYAYLLPYAQVARLAAGLAPLLTPHTPPKITAFYAVRAVQGVLCAAAESALYRSTSRVFGSAVARVTLLFLVSSPGVFRASVEFLPSSFAMIFLTAAFAAWMLRSFPFAIFGVALASLLGWVFAAVMAIPMALDILLSERGVIVFAKYAALSGLAILAAMISCDSAYYGIVVVTPLNHLLYNVFPAEGAGSHIFGIESTMFYVINLFLNCNIAAVLLASFPLLCIFHACAAVIWPSSRRSESFAKVRFLVPPFVWLIILGSQPHKEERFLAPCYTFIALVAAVAFVDWLNLFFQIVGLGGNAMQDSALHKRTDIETRNSAPTISGSVSAARATKRILSAFLVLFSMALGMSRTLMQIKAFQAPLHVYHYLSHVELRDGKGPRNAPIMFALPQQEVNICIGKEWYRFPTNFFLPHRRFRIRFIRAGFTGLMPKPFLEDESGTRVIPPGMNELNHEDPNQFYDWRENVGCHYMLDLNLSHRGILPDDDAIHNTPIAEGSGKVVYSEPFLDTERSSAGYRAFYVPFSNSKLVYGRYELIRNLDLLPNAR